MTLPLEGFDFSYDPPDFERMAAKGYRFVVSYLDYRGAPAGKCLTRARVRSIQNAGLALVLNLEVTKGRMKGGRVYGVADAKDAANSIAALGLPAQSVVYFSADFDQTTDVQLDKIDAYLSGAASVLGLGRVGIYGEYDVLRHVRQAGTAKWFWETYAWSHGKFADFAHLYQHQNGQRMAGGVVDLDWAYAADFGQITPNLPDSSTQEPDLEIVDDTARLIHVHDGATVYDPFTGNKLTTITTGFDRVVALRVNGIPNRSSDYYLGRFPNGGAGTPVTAIPIGSADVTATLTPPAPDTTPFTQADLDNAKAEGVQFEKQRIAGILGLD